MNFIKLKLVLDINEGEIPLNVFQKLQKDEYFRDDPREVNFFILSSEAKKLIYRFKSIRNMPRNC